MKYVIGIETNGQPVYKQEFSNDIPLLNRRKAVNAMKDIINSIKSGEGIERLNAVTSAVQLTKETLLKDSIYTVALDYNENEQPIRIESNAITEEHQQEWQAIEYSIYKQNDWNTGGEPVEVFIPRMNADVPILRDCFKNEIGIAELLKSD